MGGNVSHFCHTAFWMDCVLFPQRVENAYWNNSIKPQDVNASVNQGLCFFCLFLIRLVFTSDLECCILDPAANGAWKKIQSLKSSVLGNLSLLQKVLFQAFEHHMVNQPHSSNLKKFSQTSVPVPSFYFYFDWQTWRRLTWSFQSQLEVRLWCSLHLYNFCVCV